MSPTHGIEQLEHMQLTLVEPAYVRRTSTERILGTFGHHSAHRERFQTLEQSLIVTSCCQQNSRRNRQVAGTDTHAPTHTHTRPGGQACRPHTRTQRHTHTHRDTGTRHRRTHTHTDRHTRRHTHARAHRHTHTYTYTYTHTRAHTPTHAPHAKVHEKHSYMPPIHAHEST